MVKRLIRAAAALAVASSLVFAVPHLGASAAGDTLVISQGVDPDTLDPIKTSVTTSSNVHAQMFDYLARREAGGKLTPELAVSWRTVNPTTWEFKLRHNVKFWNGDPFTSADVKFTVEKILDPAYKSQQAPRVNTVARVETPDPYTVRMITKKATPLPPAITRPVFMVDAKYWQAHGDAYMNEHPMGTGPYVFKSWRKDDELDLDANANYWGGKPPIAHVAFKPIPEAASRVAALRTGAADVITNVPTQYQTQIAGGTTTRLASARSVRILYIAFNTMKPGPQQNRLLRQAFNYAIDVPAIVKNVLGGRGYETATPVPPDFFGYDPTVPFYKHDIAKAKDLLAKAGFPDGKGLPEIVINSPNGRYARDKEVAEAVAGQLSAIGVRATVRTGEWTNYLAQAEHRDLIPMYMLGWGNITYDADNTLSSQLVSSGLTSTYGDPQVDKWVEDARYELDPQKRKPLYAKALRIIHDDAPWLFLFQYVDLYGLSKRLQWSPRGDEAMYVMDMRVRS